MLQYIKYSMFQHTQHNSKKTIFFLSWTIVSIILIFLVGGIKNTKVAFALAGTIDDTNKYAWSENIGWINFNPTGVAVTVNDSTLTGHVWGENYGWINLSPTNSGVTNNTSGTLGGYAWGENIGFIDFSNVTIDSDGYFHGTASSTVTGRIAFNCIDRNVCASSDFKVRTSWRPQSAREQCQNGTDDDSDGLTDYPSDLGCSSVADTSEDGESKFSGVILPATFSPVNQSGKQDTGTTTGSLVDTSSQKTTSTSQTEKPKNKEVITQKFPTTTSKSTENNTITNTPTGSQINTPSSTSTSDTINSTEKQSTFLKKIWKSITNFFKRLFR